nr:reverse transcriptase domain-containing protein [Tanacetum cinerariifolium]
MSTRSFARNLFPPLDNPELTIRRRSLADPTLLNDFEMATDGNRDPPVPNLRTMEELCQPSLNGQEIASLKAEMAEVNKNLMRVLQVNQQVKAVTPSCETCGGPHSYNYCPATVGQTQNVYAEGAYQGGRNQFFQGASHSPNPPPAYQAPAYQAPGYQAPVHQPPIPQPQVVTTNEFTNYIKANDVILKNRQTNMTSLTNSNLELKNMFGQFMKINTASSSGSGTLPSNTITNLKKDLKGITTRSGTAYQGPTIPTTSSSLPKVVKRETEVIKDTVHPTNNGSTKDVQPLIVQIETHNPNSEPVIAPIIETVVSPTKKALINVFEGELTLRVGKEAITFNLDQTSRYSANYNDMTTNQIDVIDMAYEEYSQEVLSFSDVIASGNPTPYYDPIVSTSSPTLTPFKNSNFLLEEVDAFLALEDDPTSPKVELKDLPPHLEYAFLEGNNKLLVMIAKDLKDEERTTLIKVLKSHKRAIAWKLSDIKGINLEFCTHKILIAEDFKLVVQHQRRVNPRIHDVIKKEVEKLLDAGLIYLISDSPWEKSHFMVKDDIVLGHKISKNVIKVDKAKVDVIAKLPHPTTVKGVVLGQRHEKHFRPIHYASKTMTEAELKYTTTEKEMLAVIFQGETALMGSHPSRVQIQICEIFDIWGIDFMGKFSSSRGNKYILVAVDYLSKWVEAKALPTNDVRVVWKILKSLFARFGTPRTIISDHGTYFCNDQFAKVMLKYGVTYRLATTYHPQTNGQVEVSNRGLKRILERTVGENRASWSDKLDDALWAFRTAFKTPIGCTPYKLTVGDHIKVQLNELNELRDQAYENSLIYKEKTKRLHDSKIKDRAFNIGDRVLFFNSRLKIFLGKLKTRWSGPFTITQLFPYGTVELSQIDGPNFKVNGHRLKHYFGYDIPKIVVLDLQTFPKDQ